MDRSVPGPETRQPGQMGAWAPYYDMIMKILTLGREGRLRRMEVDLSLARPGDTVLEVGCGTGTLTLAVAQRVGPTSQVHGIDLAPEMIKVATGKNRRAGSPVTFQVGQIDRLPFADASVDVTICSFMIFHMPDDVRARGIREIFRVLRDGGTLLVVDAAQTHLDALGRALAEVGLTPTDTGTRKLAHLAPTVRYLRATARKEHTARKEGTARPPA